MASSTAALFRFPHSVQAVLQQIRIGLGIQGEQQQLGDAVALLDDRDRWVEDNLAAIDSRVSTLSGLPSGALLDWAGPTPPEGFLICDGAAVSRTTYPNLFAAIGITWGAGDGSNTFNLPDLRGRTAIGVGTGPGLTARVIGTTGGEERHALTANENGAHTHGAVFALGAGSSFATTISGVDANGSTASSGSGAPHNNMQPFTVLWKIIKT